ncbi:MAG: hypothetical protein OHK0044_02900 [Burkholderiaceae bacterium]
MIARLFTVLVALLVAGGVAAQGVRKIPADAPKGRFAALQLPLVAIDGRQYRLAPGARIFNANNLTVTPSLVPADTPVRYELDAQGLVRTVWIVEAAAGTERTAPQR